MKSRVKTQPQLRKVEIDSRRPSPQFSQSNHEAPASKNNKERGNFKATEPSSSRSTRSSGSEMVFSKSLRHSRDEWIRQKPEISRLYVEKTLQLSMVVAEMAKKGFHAT